MCATTRFFLFITHWISCFADLDIDSLNGDQYLLQTGFFWDGISCRLMIWREIFVFYRKEWTKNFPWIWNSEQNRHLFGNFWTIHFHENFLTSCTSKNRRMKTKGVDFLNNALSISILKISSSRSFFILIFNFWIKSKINSRAIF